ncbi:hypothetical protein TOT_010000064 [Theileria orientalis strain Shintoku]|uniref:Secreted protein n=1 Tax=Theileria orientalis strain Shintoku TaxID=869250 RepID=J7MGM0_THEOR|nr:hypothetical protein TOT_010000064 [Theileria orientalis strain Shintoku]BAM38596.1 hypothetical protein TOT_010000064 [Theileria orientalis strain Shintoku]|eukprot:XP_009688897.1 hypothetical protein TOT_010000064 [Theileria orientalis strain Shintoku]
MLGSVHQLRMYVVLFFMWNFSSNLFCEGSGCCRTGTLHSKFLVVYLPSDAGSFQRIVAFRLERLLICQVCKVVTQDRRGVYPWPNVSLINLHKSNINYGNWFGRYSFNSFRFILDGPINLISTCSLVQKLNMSGLGKTYFFWKNGLPLCLSHNRNV